MLPATSSFLRRRAARWATLVGGLLLAMTRVAGGPEGGSVVAGNATIATTGANTTVTADNNSVLRWNSFDLGSHESVTFLQPGADARVLNWIGSLTPSQINGSITANGQVYLLNPAGVYFGNTAVVDVGGLYTAAGSLSKEDFLAGLNRFTGLSGEVRNAGSIRGDFVAFVGRSVENTGSIVSPNGFIGLVAGDQVFLGQNGSLVYVEAARTTVTATDSATGVKNSGTIDAGRGSAMLGAGDLYAVAITQDGNLVASDVRLQGQGSGTVQVNGTIDATSATGQGGHIEITGEKVRIGNSATLDASGATGGGTVLVGGDYQGKNADVRNATSTVVGTGATLRADAGQTGDGGRVIVWADGVTRYGGSIFARGGATGGHGGFAEVSGKGRLQFVGTADLTAAFGRVGTLLLDPTHITIQGGSSSAADINGNGTLGDDINAAGDLDDAAADHSGATSIITAGNVQTLVNAANLTLAATQTININADLTWADHVLTLNAGTNININADLTASNAGGGMAFTAGTNLDISGAHNLSATAGSISLTVGGGISQGTGEIGATNLTIAGTSGVGSSGDRLNTRVANLILNKGAGDTYIDEGTGLNVRGTTAGLLDIVTGGGATHDVTQSNDLTVGGAFTLAAGLGDITLDDANNAFSSTVSLSGAAVSVRNNTDLTLGTTAATGSLTLSTGVTGGDITSTAQITASGTTVTTTGDISLTNSANTFGTMSLGGAGPASLTIVTSGSYATPSATIGSGSGAVNITANGITQQDGLDAGAVTLTAGSGNISFNDAANDISSITVVSGGTVSLHSDDPLTVKVTTATSVTVSSDESIVLDGVTVTDDLAINLEPAKSLTQTGIISVADDFTITVGNGSGDSDINLGTQANSVAGTFTLSDAFNNVHDFSWRNQHASANTPTLSGLGNLHDLTLNLPNAVISLSGTIGSDGAQLFLTPVSLGGNTTLNASAANVTFSSTVVAGGSGRSLTVSTSGTTTFSSTVGAGGGSSAVDGLTLSGGGAVVFNGNVSSTDNVSASGAAQINSDMSITTTNDPITFSSTIDSESGETNNLTLSAGSGTVTLSGNIGTAVGGELGNLTVSSTSTTAVALPSIEADTLNLTIGGNLTDSGTLTIAGLTTLDTGATHDITLNSAGNTFGSVVVTNANDVTLVDNSPLALGGVIATGNLSLTANGAISQTGLLGVTGNLTLTATTGNSDIGLSSAGNSVGGTISFGGTVANIRDVFLSSTAATGSGPSLTGLSGLRNLVLDFPNRTTSISGTITPGGFATFGGPVSLSGATTINAGGVITFSSTINGTQTLALNTTSATILGGVVGGSTPLTSLTTNAGGTTQIGGNVTTTGIQTYNDAVQLDADATLHTTNNVITFGSTLNSQSGEKNDLAIETGSAAPAFGGAIGGLGGGGFGQLDITTTAPALTLPAITADALNVIAFGDIDDTGVLTIAGAATFDAGFVAGHDITLNNPANTFGSVAFTHAGSVVVGDTGSLVLGPSSINGTLDVTFGGTLTQSGAIDVAGATTLTVLNAGTDVDLSTSDNDFKATMTVVNPGNIRDFALTSLNNNASGFAPLASSFTGLRNLTYTFPNSPISISGVINSTGALNYGGPIDVLSDSTLNAASIRFGSTLNGAFALTLNTTGTTELLGVVGGVTPLTSLTTNAGGTTSIGANITTTGLQNFGDAVILVGNTTLTSTLNDTISFGSTINGAFSLTATTAGLTTFSGVIGGTTPLTSITANGGGTTNIAGNITTTGAQTYSDAATLTGNATLTSTASGNIGFGSTLNGAFSLAVNTAGVTSFANAVGGTVELTSLTTDAAGSTSLASSVITDGAQTFNDAVNLTGPVSLVSFLGANVTLASTVNGAQSLVITTSGTTQLGGVVGGGTALSSLITNGGGTTEIDGNVTTTGAQTYNDAVLLTSNATLTSTAAGNIGFGSTVNGARTLAVNTAGTTAFGGIVGGSAALTSLTTNVGGTTTIANNITTTGAQTFGDAVTLLNNATLTSTGSGNIGFSSTLNGAFTLNANTAGTTSFGGAVGGISALTGLITDSAGDTTLNGNITANGVITLNDAVTLGSNSTLTSAGGSTIALNSTVNGAQSLIVNTVGSTVFGGVVGGTVALTNLTTNASGTTSLSGNVTTTGDQTYNDAVTLTGGATLTSSGAGNIGFGSTINGAQTLAVNTTGTTTFLGAIGGSTALTSLTTNAGGTTQIGAGITTTGAQTFNDTVVLTGATTLTSSSSGNIGFAGALDGATTLAINTNGTTTFGGTVGGTTALSGITTNAGGTTVIDGNITTSGGQSFGDAVTLGGASSTLTSSGGGTIGFSNTLNGAASLTVNTVGTTTFGGVVGGSTPLTSITTNAGGTTQIGGNVSTTGTQTYNDAVQFLAATTLASSGAGAITFNSTVNGGFAVNVNTGGSTIFGGVVGGTTALTSLTTDSTGTTSLGGNVTTTGAQNYNDAVTLTGNTSLSSSGGAGLTFGSTLNGAFTFAANTTGTTTFSGAVGGSIPLVSLVTNAGGTTNIGGNITTSGLMQFFDAVQLTGPSTLTSTANAVDFESTLNGAQTLTVSSNTYTILSFGAGTTTPLTSLSISSAIETYVAGNVSTVGGQTFNGPLFLFGDSAFASSASGTLAFNGAVNSTVSGLYNFAANTSGATTFASGIGASTAFASITTDVAGTTSLGGTVGAAGAVAFNDAVTLTNGTTVAGGSVTFGSTINGGQTLAVNTIGATTFSGVIGGSTALTSVTTNVGGTTSIGGNVTTTGGQTYNDAVTLAADATLASTGGGTVSFGSTVNGARNLTVNTAGTTSFGGAVGGTTALTGLTTDAAGATSLAGNVTTTGAQTFNDAVTLAAATTLTSSGAGNIGFGSTVNGAADLTVNTSGATSFGGVVGGTTALTSLTTNAGGTTTLGGNVTTTGAQNFNDAVTLGGNTTLASSGGGSIGFGSTVNGAADLTVNTTGTTSFSGVVGGSTPLTSITTNAGGTTQIGGNVTTTGAQTYNDAVQFLAASTLASTGAGAISFNSTVNGAAAVTVNTAGTTTFGGAVGGTTALTSLTTNAGGTTRLGGNVTTTGAQTYNDAVLLLGNSTLTSTGGANLTLASTVNGAFSLTGNTAGATIFGSVVGGVTPLASITTNAGGSTSFGGNITTTGSQFYGDTIQLSADSVLTTTNSTVTLAGGLDSAVGQTNNLTILTGTGATTFGGTVGGGAGGALGAVVINTTSAVILTATTADTLDIIAGGSVTDTGALVISGDVHISAPGADVILDSPGNSFGTLNLNANNITVLESGVMTLGTVNAAGSLTLGASGSITGASEINVGGLTTLTATGAISLTDPANTFLGAVTFGGAPSSLALVDDTPLDMGALTVGGGAGNLTLTAPGLTQSGAIVAGATTLNGGSSTIDFTNVGNNFGALTLTGSTVAVTEAGSLQVTSATAGNLTLTSLTGTVDVDLATLSGAFVVNANLGAMLGQINAASANVTAGGAITDDGDLTITGAATFNAGANAITLGDTTTANFGSLTLTGGAVSVTESSAMQVTSANAASLALATTTGGIDIDSANVTGLASITSAAGLNFGSVSFGSLLAQAFGAITDDGNFTVVGSANFNAGANAITLGDTTTANFGSLALAGGTVNVRTGSALNITTATANSLTLTTTSGGIDLDSATVVGALTTNSASTTNLGAVSAATLSLTGAGDVTDDGTVAITGNTLIAAGSGAITLDSAANSFGDLTLSGASATITESGPITDGGAWSIAGATTLNAGAGAITLDALASSTGALGLTGGTVSVNRTGAITLGAVNAGTLSLTSPAGISGTAAITAGATTFQAGSGSVSLTNAGNVFGDLTVAGGTVTIYEGGPMTDGGAWTTTGLTTLNAGTNSITLDNPANVLGDLVLVGGIVSVRENDAITDGGNWSTGEITLNAGTNAITLDSLGSVTGALNLTGGAVSVSRTGLIELGLVNSTSLALASPTGFSSSVALTTGAATFDAGSGLISFTNPGNVFGDLTLTGGTITIVENDVITDGGAWTTTGITTLNAGGNAIVLNNPGNVLGPLVLTGGSVAITENDAITQGAAWITGATSLNAGGNDITLTQTGNVLGALTFNGANVQVVENDAISLAGSNAATSLALTASGAITDAPGTTLNVSGTATLLAGTNAITLGEDAGDTTNFGSLVFTGGNVAISEDSSMSIRGTATGALTLNGAGIALGGVTAALLNLTSTGAITDTAATNVAGATVINAAGQTVTLDETASDFGSLQITGGAITVRDATALTLNGIIASGNVSITAATNLTQLADITASGASAVDLRATSGAITTSAGVGTTTGGGAIRYESGTNAVLGGLSAAGGTVTVKAGGSAQFLSALNFSGVFDVTAGAAGIEFLQTINGTGAASDLTFRTTGNTRFGAAVGNISGPDSMTTDAGGTTVIAGGTFAVNGALTLGDDVTLVGDTTIGAGSASVTGPVRAQTDGGSALTLNISGDATFTGPLGATGARLSSLTTNAGGRTILNGGGVTTTGAQSFGDAVVLGAATTFTASTLTFSGALDSAAISGSSGPAPAVGPSDVIANVGGATIFAGAVGQGSRLGAVTTDAGGSTAIRGNFNASSANFGDAVTFDGAALTKVDTTGALKFASDVTIGTDLSLRAATGDLTLAKGATGAGRGLTLEAPTGTISVAAALGGSAARFREVMASGRNVSVSDVWTTGNLALANGRGAGTAGGQRNDYIEILGSHLDSENGDVILGSGATTTDASDDKTSAPLRSSIFKSNDGDLFVVGKNVTIQPFERMAVRNGNLVLFADDTLTVSSTAASNTLALIGNSIRLRSRGAQQFEYGTPSVVVDDRGTDLVSGAVLFFQPTGLPGVPARSNLTTYDFATSTGTIRTDNPGNVVQVLGTNTVFVADLRDNLLRPLAPGIAYLDLSTAPGLTEAGMVSIPPDRFGPVNDTPLIALVAQGAQVRNSLEQAFTPIVPREEVSVPESDPNVSDAVRDHLRALGIYARKLKAEELIARGRRAGLFDEVPRKARPDPQDYMVVDARMEDRAVRAVISKAREAGLIGEERAEFAHAAQSLQVSFGRFEATGVDSADGRLFRGWLEHETDSDSATVLQLVRSIEATIRQIELLGLTRQELEISKEQIYGSILSGRLNAHADFLRELIESGASSQTAGDAPKTTIDGKVAASVIAPSEPNRFAAALPVATPLLRVP